MGRRGRSPKPTNLKLIQGNPGRRPLNRQEPQPTVGAPVCPRFLKGQSKVAWRRIVPLLEDMGILTLADGPALELLCDAYGEWRNARDALVGGMTYSSETQNGVMIRIRPEVKIAADAWRRVRAMLQEFGLTPSSRTQVKRIPDYEMDPFEEFIKRGKGTEA